MSTKKPPRVSITERATQTAAILDSDPRYRKGIENPFGLPSQGIQLKDASKVARWFNGAIMADHIWKYRQIGYDQVRPEELVDPDQAGAYQVSVEGYVVRGERGREILMSIPKVVFQERQRVKTERNLKDMRDFDKQKADMLQAAAAKYGAEAADYLNGAYGGPIGSVRTDREVIEVRPEEE